jgi:hypothetical protein
MVLVIGAAGLTLILALRGRQIAESGSAPHGDFSRFDEYLMRCRHFSNANGQAQPDWGEAERACETALDLNPISDEAHSLLKRINLEKEALGALTRAEAAMHKLDEMGALRLLAAIPEESAYFSKARQSALEIKSQAARKLQAQCAKLLKMRMWKSAVPKCEQYISLTCQNEPRASTGGPASRPAQVESLAGSRALYRSFLRARQKVRPGALPWQCPEQKLLRDFETLPSAHVAIKDALLARAAEPLIGEALFNYWQGNIASALGGLEKLASQPTASNSRSSAEELRERIWSVLQLEKSGLTALEADEPERAAKPLRAALQRDRDVLGGRQAAPSFVERSIRREMGARCYQRGKYWADRADIRRACRIWKLGQSFSPASLSLLQALKHCAERAGELVDAARSCGELASAAELSTSDDLLRQRIAAKRATWACH